VLGQKTLQRTPTALDRVNVRRLTLYMRKVFTTLGRQFLGEPNNHFTWSAVKAVFTPVIDDLVNKQAIDKGIVICDDTNNTPQSIANGELHVRIAVVPTKAAEAIVIDAVLLSHGVRFDEALGTL